MEVLLCDYGSMNFVRYKSCEAARQATRVEYRIRAVHIETHVPKPDSHMRALVHACHSHTPKVKEPVC